MIIFDVLLNILLLILYYLLFLHKTYDLLLFNSHLRFFKVIEELLNVPFYRQISYFMIY